MSERYPDERIETSRVVKAPADTIFAVLRDPWGHVAIDASGMLQSVEGDVVAAVGDRFLVHMDRESYGDIPDLKEYDVTVVIEEYEPDRLITWSIIGRVRPPIGHRWGYRLEPVDGGTQVTSVLDWSHARDDWKDQFPIVDEDGLKATLGILERAARLGYVRGS
ncbi:MAG: SRPBCC family protein [Aeromicrobium erythreum]|jgi:hypothetical protein